MWNRSEQTICAVSTPDGAGGISVIRVSGKKALSVCRKISRSLGGKAVESHRVYFSDVIDLQENKIDEAVFTYFAEGRSFTGDEVVEISCHGSRFIVRQILDLLVQLGCKHAEKGEFTYRAFMSGKIDLVQAESVLSLIESQSAASAKIAVRQLSGQNSTEIETLISELTWCLAHIEASIDFAEQGVEVVDPCVLLKKLKFVMVSLERLIKSYRTGRLIKDGISIALVGEPNVGKSSLLNLLVQSDRAIVTPIAGTTRDVIADQVLYNGIKIQLSDTAGLRATKDQIELMGMEKTRKEAEQADVLCFVLDCSEKHWDKAISLADKLQNEKKIFLFNKADKLSASQQEELISGFPRRANALFTSALKLDSRDEIFTHILATIGNLDHLNEAIVSSSRQHENLSYSSEMISSSILELEHKTGSEFVAMYLKESLISLQKILGIVYDDQILDRVFKEFCLGK